MASGGDVVVVVDWSPFDPLFKLLHQSPSTPSHLEEILEDLAFWIAVLMDPPQGLVGGDDDSLEKLASCIAQIGSVISSLDLKDMDHHDLIHHLESVISNSGFKKIAPQSGIHEAVLAAKETYDNTPSPSDIHSPIGSVISSLDLKDMDHHDYDNTPSPSDIHSPIGSVISSLDLKDMDHHDYDNTPSPSDIHSPIGSVISSLDLKDMDHHDLIHHLESVISSSGFKKIAPQSRIHEAVLAAKKTYNNRPYPSDIHFPSAARLGFIDRVVKNLDQLMQAEPISTGPLKYYTWQLQQKLNLVSCGLMEIPESRKEEPYVDLLIQSIVDLAYQSKYAIDSFLVGEISMWYCLYGLCASILPELQQQVAQVKIESGVMQTAVSSSVERGTELVVDLAPFDALFKFVDESPSSMRTMLKVAFDNFTYLIAILMDPPQDLVGGYLLKQLEFLICHIGSLISSFDVKKIEQQNEMATILLREFTFFPAPAAIAICEAVDAAKETYDSWPRPSDVDFPRTDQLGFIDHLVENLDQLMKDKADFVGPLKYYTVQLQQKLHLVSSCILEIPESRKEAEDVKYLIQGITDLAYRSEYVIDSFLVRDIPICYCMAWLHIILAELERKVRQVKTESGDIQSVISRIIDMRQRESEIIPIVNDSDINSKLSEIFTHPDIIKCFYVRTRSLVGSYRERRREVFLQLLRNASFETAFVGTESEKELKTLVRDLLRGIDSFIILEDVRDIPALNDIRRVLSSYGVFKILLTTSSPELVVQINRNNFSRESSEDHISTSQSDKPTIDDKVIGFKRETQRMLELLTGGQTKLCIISIVGMAGQGKTTLARKLCRDPLIINYFDTLSSCCVSQVYQKRELLLELLGEVVQHTDTIQNKNDEELAEMLYKNLKGRRFLIFLDDIWKIDVWNDLARCFPNENNGSRIMFTTRIRELASQAKSDSILQPLLPLSSDESWELLRYKVFEKESCPLKLLAVGRQIAENCGGLPLSVVLIGGLLAKMKKKVKVWEHVARTLSSRILSDAEAHGRYAIELSYKQLPDSLKSCFLYFGAFLEDREILVRKLVRLWIAEGFIKHIDLKSLEGVAVDYLMDLVGRSLIIVAQEKSTGGVKSCRMHDLLREFCLTKAREENFLHQIKGYDEHFLSSSDSLDYGTNPNYFCSSGPIVYDLRRLSIYSKRNHFILLKPYGPFVRSLLFFASSDMCPIYSYDISFIFGNFKFLKILDLEEINIGDSFKTIDVLVLLRYLAVQSDSDFIPSSIANLWSLETLLFKGLSDKVVKIPDAIWDMDKLRHVHINGCVSFDVEPHRLENSSILDNLQTFSTPSLVYGDDMLKILRRQRGIRKLKCIFLDSWDDAKDCNQFPELEFLNQLVSLKAFYNGKCLYPRKFSFPSKLKKLTLSNFRMPWSEISQLAALSNLEVLKLLDNAFEGEVWEMEDEVFPKLKFLKLQALNVVKWIAFDDHFPCLGQLILHKCEQLEEIPLAIGDINTLRTIEVMWCSSSTATSARKIRDDQLEYGQA